MNDSNINRTLEEIENDFWGEPEYDSYLVTTIHRLRKKKIADFEIEDLRIMIGQSRGLPVLIPIAIYRLNQDILVEGDNYDGDLLVNVLTSDPSFWKNHPELKNKMTTLFEDKINLLKESKISERNRHIFSKYTTLSKINSTLAHQLNHYFFPLGKPTVLSISFALSTLS